MILNSQSCCCRHCLNPNENFYVEVKNECTVYINCLLEYKIHGKRIIKPSHTFAPGKVEHIVFPGDAHRLCLKVFNSSFSPPSIICTKFPLDNIITRYKVITTPQGIFQCINIQ